MEEFDFLDKFIAVTGASEEEARNYFKVTEGNLEQAVVLFFESDSTSQPIPPKRDILTGGFGSGEGSYSIKESPQRPREPDSRTFAGETTSNSQNNILAKLYSPPFDIMSSENFEKTRSKAKSAGKWVMINIQKLNDFSSQLLNRDLWSNDTVKDVIRAHFYFLQFNNDSMDGSKYINFYPVNKYPHIAVIDPRTGERLKVWDTQLEPTEFLISVTDFLERFSLEEEPEASGKNKISDDASVMSVDEQSKIESQNSNDITNNDDLKEVNSTFEETSYNSIFDSIEPIERPDPTGPESASIKFRLEGRQIIKKFNKKDPVRCIFEYLKASVPELKDKTFELNYLRTNLLGKTDETIEEAGLVNAAIHVVLTTFD